MRIFLKKGAAVFLCAGVMLLGGCNRIPYNTVSVPENSQSATETDPPEAVPVPSLDKYEPIDVTITPMDYSAEIQLEDACSNELHDYLNGYNGRGYIQIDKYETATFNVYAPTTQYYKLTLYMCAFGTGVNVIVGGERVWAEDGDYETYDGVSKGIIYAEDITSFTPFTLNGIYLKKGDNTVTLQSVRGTAYMDMVVIQNGKSAEEGFYTISNAPVSPNADINTCRLMNYFYEIYGKKTLTAQQVTSGTDAEIAALYNATGRLPAIRVGDLAFATSRSSLYDEDMEDIDLAEKWAERGGIVAYDWTWYSPADDSHYLATMTDFGIKGIYSQPDVSEASLETIEQLYGSGQISRECFRLIQDMEEVKEALQRLEEKGITVLFRPVPDGGKGGYWWSSGGEDYKWLWRTLFKRFTQYYGLKNIIWVWSGGSTDFYPGDEYVDIVGEDIYNVTGDSGNSHFLGTVFYNTVRAAAMTDCWRIPDPDVLKQDNSKWLWFSLGKGNCLIDENGNISPKYTPVSTIDKAYNHQDFVTLDELPKLRD